MDVSAEFSPRSAWPTRAARAYHQIREMIFDGTISADSVLVEARLGELLGMSRTPVREALYRLEAEGFLTSLPRGGFSVVALSEDDLHGLYMIRACLEGLAASTAATKLTRVDVARLEDLYDEMRAAVEAGSDEELARLNREFHRTIAVASGNRHLREILDNVKGVFERFRANAVADPGRRAQAHLEHGQLIDALRDRDADKARRLAEDHVHRALRQGTDLSKKS
ncbi:MAG TPA: GntR family transcriptional regulator [Streptosporangiaceae bacterium]|nr:GntR family transcriptional regulator [Streptosporangiaceae bacterium]